MTSASAGTSLMVGKKSLDRFMWAPTAELVGKDAQQVVIEGGEHEGHQQEQTDLGGDLLFARANRVPPQTFHGEKQNVPAVEDRDGEQVEDTQADAEHRH